MTVAELINKLKTFPTNLKVGVITATDTVADTYHILDVEYDPDEEDNRVLIVV